jgi:hypothetical protein
MLLEITLAEYLGANHVQITFNDGRVGMVNLQALAGTTPESVFSAFTDEKFVRQCSLAHGTLCWPGERDVAAEYLYFLAFQDDPALYSLFRQWGYLGDGANMLAA